MNFFNEAVEDVQRVFLLEGSEMVVSPRLQLIAALTLAEVFSSYWDEYNAAHQKPNERFRTWFSEFCEGEANITYLGNAYFRRLGAAPLLDLRHSLIHFYGLSEQKEGMKISLVSSHMDDRTLEQFKSGLGRQVAVLKPVDFYYLFRDGAELMLKAMKQNIVDAQIDESTKWKHVEGINRIYQKFANEGAKQVLIPTAR